MTPAARTGLGIAVVIALAAVGVAVTRRGRALPPVVPTVPAVDLLSQNAIVENLKSTGDNVFTSRLADTTIIFPASSWENARDAGLTFGDVLAREQSNAWPMLNAVGQELGLSEIYISSLYRATGTGPHTEGRAIDIGYVRRGSAPLVLLKRTGDEPEPKLAKQLRKALVALGATQVLTPWWIFSKGTRDDPNTGAEGIDADHLSHLHVTLEKMT